MDREEIKLILDLMREHDLAEFELEQDGVRLRLRKHSAPEVLARAAAPALAPVEAAVSPSPAVPDRSAAQAPPSESVEDGDLAVIKSPIVGTFYRSGEPGAKPFAEVGQRVKQGQVLCIIEAMKLMNEINAECDGEIVKVYVESGQAVHYGERLFAIRPT